MMTRTDRLLWNSKHSKQSFSCYSIFSASFKTSTEKDPEESQFNIAIKFTLGDCTMLNIFPSIHIGCLKSIQSKKQTHKQKGTSSNMRNEGKRKIACECWYGKETCWIYLEFFASRLPTPRHGFSRPTKPKWRMFTSENRWNGAAFGRIVK